MTDLVLSILSVGGIGLLVGAWVLWRRGTDARKAFLMVVAALVMFANVAIWTIPDSNGARLAGGQNSAVAD